MNEAKVYDAVGMACGTSPDGQELVGLLFPTGIGEECNELYMTLPAAKALLLDLRDAIAACESHQQGE